MGQIEKLIEKFNKKPIPNDITFNEVKRLAEYYGCIVKESGGKHPIKVVHLETGKIIPIPRHGKHVQEVYIKQLKEIFY